MGSKLPRLTLQGFDYEKRPAERLEIPVAQRIAAIRAQRSGERARAREKAERKLRPQPAAHQPFHQPRPRGEHSGVTAGAAAPQRSISSLARKRLPSRGVRRRSLI